MSIGTCSRKAQDLHATKSLAAAALRQYACGVTVGLIGEAAASVDVAQRVMDRDEIVHILGGFALFADLSRPEELEPITHTFDEEWFGEDQRILRQGFTGTGFYVILEGAASVRIDGQERARLSRGDFFGEISILLDEPPTADVVAVTPLRCLVLGRSEVADWLTSKPTVAFRMLQAEARRLRTTNQWRS